MTRREDQDVTRIEANYLVDLLDLVDTALQRVEDAVADVRALTGRGGELARLRTALERAEMQQMADDVLTGLRSKGPRKRRMSRTARKRRVDRMMEAIVAARPSRVDGEDWTTKAGRVQRGVEALLDQVDLKRPPEK